MNFPRTSRTALLVLLVMGATACTSVRPVADSDAWTARRSALLLLDNWELKGRIAVKSDSEGGQARLLWQQLGESSRIHLSGPFGAGAYDLVWEPEFVSISDASGAKSAEYKGRSAGEKFLTEQLGWAFPAGSLRFWVLGLLDPAAAGREHFDAAGELSGLQQNGWTISYDRYASELGFSLPTRINIENEHARLRIVVSKWTLAETSG